jgi:hypothetical protein
MQAQFLGRRLQALQCTQIVSSLFRDAQQLMLLHSAGQRIPAGKITPQFLSRNVTIEEEPAPTKLQTVSPVSVVPSGAFMSHLQLTPY